MKTIASKAKHLLEIKVCLIWVILTNMILYVFNFYFNPTPTITKLPNKSLLPIPSGYTRIIIPIDFIFSPITQQLFELRSKNLNSFFITVRYIAPANIEGQNDNHDNDHWSGKHIIEIHEKDFLTLKLAQSTEQMQSLDSWIGLPYLKSLALKNKKYHHTKDSYEEIIF